MNEVCVCVVVGMDERACIDFVLNVEWMAHCRKGRQICLNVMQNLGLNDYF